MAYYVEALVYHVQDSVNQVLIKVLKLFTLPLTRFGHCELRGCSLPETGSYLDQNIDVGVPRRASKGPASSAEILVQMAASVRKRTMNVVPFWPFPKTGVESSIHTEGNVSSNSPSSSSEPDQAEPKPSGKRKRKSHIIHESDQTPRTLSFDPENIIDPRSTEWIPCAEVAHDLQDRIRKGFDRDVRNTLRSECPRPSLLGKMAEMPALDPNMDTFIKRFSKDPKKGLNRAWKAC
ncbi:hypothetical protein NDU88_006302 [Pleurodeles waltl]|uniref:Uncharacterized protein n=1 Tax=Pleurodeles waltl TaxID=8319 RepID=A0AAV7QNR5_PLEWA|nr:hypothetical protein NDU88_006302 [Pleurodeles waltl]